MQVPNINPKISYIGDGVQTQFDYPFPIFDAEDIKVYFNNVLQHMDCTISGEGETSGGYVKFETPPSLNTVITIQRELDLERLSNFTNSGNYAASSLNGELNYLIACVQQVNNADSKKLSFPTMENHYKTTLPAKDIRANKLLSFDSDGNPTVTKKSEDGFSIFSTDTFLADGSSSVERTLLDKNKDLVSVKDFGAKGDGITDDTLAMQSAIDESNNIFIPTGTYNISSSLNIKENTFVSGVGNNSIIYAINNDFDVFNVIGSNSVIENVKLLNGDAGIRLFGKYSPCVQNNISNVIIESAEMGIVLDGYESTSNPCYWNNFHNILISKPKTHGVLFTLTGDGDSPNANRFSKLRIYSHGEDTQGYGIYLQNANYHNSFVDVEINLYEGANACVILENAKETNLVNIYTETLGTLDNIVLEEGSSRTSIINHLSMSAGKAIVDNCNGDYSAINAGYPEKNTLQKTFCDDFKAKLIRYDIHFLDYQESAIHKIDLTTSFYLVSGYYGRIDMVLPKASTDNEGAEVTIKKSDFTSNAIVITEENGTGPDGKEIRLAARYDFITVVSNGANWWIKAGNLLPRSDQYYDGVSKVNPTMASPLCLISAWSGNVEVELPPADNINAIGQTLMIKKTDSSNNKVTITENGGNGPDNSNHILSNQYDFISVMSNGSQWYRIG